MSFPIFRRSKTHPVSVPVPDEQEARWRAEELLPFAGSGYGVNGREGDLALDVFVGETSVVVRTALAGVNPEDMSIQLMNDLLTIRGVRREETESSLGQCVVQECHWGSFSRSVVLPVAVRSENAQATLKNGILKITLERADLNIVEVSVLDSDDDE